MKALVIQSLCLIAILAVCNSIRIVDDAKEGSNLGDDTTVVTGTCYYNSQSNSYSVKLGVIDTLKGTSWGMFVNESFVTGWSTLYIATASGDTFSDDSKMYCSESSINFANINSGYLEGALTHSFIYQWWQSFYVNTFNGEGISASLTNYLTSQSTYGRTNAELYRNTSSYWNHVSLLFSQFDGLSKGYNDFAPVSQRLSQNDMYTLNSAGDLETLIGLYQSSAAQKSKSRAVRKNFHHMKNGLQTPSDDEIFNDPLDCSAFVKVTDDYQELYSGHTTWTDYYSMYRIYKTYEFDLEAQDTSSVTVSFSSRPGFLNSKDDWYNMDSNLVSMETTNGIYNNTLYNYVTPYCLLTWQRVIVANRMATNGQDWTQIFAKENSGTYNNQWMVVDYNKFRPGQPIQDGTLWIIEQIPGFTESGDVTSYLQTQGYWPSYNVPYFSFIYNISGYPGGNSEDGQGLDYVTAPRALLFAEYQSNVTDLSSMQWIMQSNNYQTDAISNGNPAYAISSRYDLKTANASAFGGIDSKVTSNQLLKNEVQALAISGPTHQGQPPFSWSAPQWGAVYHTGQPTVWNFTWIKMETPSVMVEDAPAISFWKLPEKDN